jgi:hypothetical protein
VARKIIESCPSCHGPLAITEVQCTRCDTQVRARYQPCDFCALSPEQSAFLRVFVTSRGNLSEVEKRLGISYPTVRSKLDEVLDQLTAVQSDPPPIPINHPGRHMILDAVARGEITAKEGLERMRALGGEG